MGGMCKWNALSVVMSYYQDLSPYEYLPGRAAALNVAWIDAQHPFGRGPVAAGLLDTLRRLAVSAPTNQTRGFHVCELCSPESVERPPSTEWEGKSRRLGSAEIWIEAANCTYACPDLVIHYIEVHDYQPPIEFLDALSGIGAGR